MHPLSVFALSPTETFFIDSFFDSLGRTEIEARLYYTGTHAYFFVEKGFFDALAGNRLVEFSVNAQALSKEFDETIHPKTRILLGSEWSPGIDNDERITVLLVPMKSGAGGYVRLEDESSKSVNANSNEREMAYINADAIGSRLAAPYLAHEFQHLINFYQKEKLKGVAEDPWLNEAISEYMPSFLGYTDPWQGSYLAKRVQDFLNLPPDSLLDWKNASADFASANLFIHYLVGRFDKNILPALIESELAGVDALDDVLLVYNTDFSGVFTDWAIANYINNITSEDGNRYLYEFPNLFYGNFHASPRATFNVIGGQNAQGTFSVRDWQMDYYKIQPAVLGPTEKNALQITFNGVDQNSRFVVFYIASDFSGKYRVRPFPLNGFQDGMVTVPDFGVVTSSLTLAVTSQLDRSATDQKFKSFSIEAELVEGAPPVFPEGSLLRTIGDTKVYVIEGLHKRWIQSPEIFNGYGHLKWERIIEVSQDVLNQYQESFLVRRDGDTKVYEVTAAGVKQWLNMTPQRFEASGRTWEQIFIVNEKELRWFIEGKEIKTP